MAIDSEHIVGILLKIFEAEVKTDSITLIAGVGGQRVPIHRAVLMANSEYFTASLGPHFKEAEETEFILDEIDGPTLKAIVDFCYTGRIELTEENVPKYLAIASGIELCLEQTCFQFLAEKLNTNNAVATLDIAEKFNGHVLREQAFDFVCELFDKLPESHVDGMDSRLMEEILKSDDVYAEERFIFERLLGWCRKDEFRRREHMTKLLKLIRLPLIPSQYLNGDTMQMIYKEFGCFEVLCAESERRIACPTANAGIRQRRSIYCLYMPHFYDDATEYPGIKIERYNSGSNEFEEFGEIQHGRRKYSELILHMNKVYVLGGELDRVAQKSVSVFDLISGKERVLPEMAAARIRFASILLGKFIYVFGGDRPNSEKLRSCERFDLDAEVWEALKPMNVARSDAAVAVLNGCICVAGGFGNSGRLRDVELFDPHNDEWIALPPMNDRRSNFAFCNSKGNLYAMEHRSIEKYDPLTTRWTKIGTMESRKNIFADSSVVVNDNIYGIAGSEFGEMKFDRNGDCLSTPFSKLKMELEFTPRRFLFCN